jgi:hypothetical protein
MKEVRAIVPFRRACLKVLARDCPCYSEPID